MAQNWIMMISEQHRYQGISYKSDIIVISGDSSGMYITESKLLVVVGGGLTVSSQNYDFGPNINICMGELDQAGQLQTLNISKNSSR